MTIAPTVPGDEDASATSRHLEKEQAAVAIAPDRSDADQSSPTGADADYRVIRIPRLPYVRLLGVVLTGVGLLLVFFLVYLFAFTSLTASRNQQRLASELASQPLQVFSLVAGRMPADGKPVAILQIPAIHLHQVVVEGTSAADLMNGPGLMPGSALPGSPGNAVIAGRRYTFGSPFGSVDHLRPGNRIQVVDGAGSFTYRVRRVRTVVPGQRDPISPTADDRLTLVTANGGVATNGRLVVQAELVGTAVAVPGSTVEVPTYETGLSGDPVAGGMAVLWSLALLVVLVVAAYVTWRGRRPLLVYLFAAPMVIACGLLACESVARALPATF